MVHVKYRLYAEYVSMTSYLLFKKNIYIFFLPCSISIKNFLYHPSCSSLLSSVTLQIDVKA